MSLRNPPAPLGGTGLPTGAIAQTYSRNLVSFTVPAIASGRLVLVSIPLITGQVITSATFISSSTALAGGSHGWAALYNPALHLLGQSTDDTGITWAATTSKTFTLTSPVTITATADYYIGYCIAATTMPTVYGLFIPSAPGVIAPAISGLSTAALTGTAPTDAAALSTPTTPYCYVS